MGAMNRCLAWSIALGAMIVVLGCGREPTVVHPPPVEVIVSKPLLEKIVDRDTYTGEVTSKDPVEIRARVRGEIKDVPFKQKGLEGKEIKANEPLFMIDDKPFQASKETAIGELTTWTAKKEAADKIIKIYDPLVKKGTVSTEELVKAISNRGEAIGGVATSKGKIADAEANISYCKIYSPIAGRIGQAMLTKGNIVNSSGQGNLLATVVRVDQLYVYFNVNERALLDYQKLLRRTFEKDKKALNLAIPVEMALATDTDYPHKGVVDFIDNQVDPKTGNIKVGARFENPKGPDGIRPLTPGLFARVRVIVSDPYPAILIADRAILSDQNLKYVLVVDRENKNEVKRVDIVPAERIQDNGLRAIESGLQGNEWIIVEGVNRARPGITVTPKEMAMPKLPTGK